MHLKNVFLLLMLTVLLVASWTFQVAYGGENSEQLDQKGDRKIVRIWYDTQDELIELTGIIAPLEVNDNYIVTDVTDRILKEITDRNFRVEVLYNNRDELIGILGDIVPKAGTEGLYHSYDELKAELQQLETDYPQIAKVYDIGDSWEKTQGIADRDILAIKISDNVMEDEDEAEVLFMGAHHAREWISVEVPFYLARHLIENYGIDPQITSYVNNGEIWIVPMLNPDGHQYSIDIDRWWRKNRRNNGDGSYGVDLNRNYSYMWGGLGSSGDPSSDIYRGTTFFSEPETQAILNLSQTHDFMAVMSYHSYGQMILYPWDYTYSAAPDGPEMQSLSQDMADLIQGVNGRVYSVMQGSDLYPASGTTDDWVYGSLGVFGFTIELRPVGFPYFELPESEIIPTWEENSPAALYLIGWTQQNIVDPFPDIKANNSAGPLFIPAGQNLSVTLSLDAGSAFGQSTDWWVVANSPMGFYYYRVDLNSWFPGFSVADQDLLFDLDQLEVLNMSDLPIGTYTFYFGVDMLVNGVLDYDQLYYDSVDVEITPIE